MKNTRKILTLLLSLALLVAGFSVTAFAAENEGSSKTYEDALAEHSKAMEFYEAGTYFELRVDNSGIVVMNDSDECKLLKGGAYSDTVSVGALSFSSVNPTKINLVQDTPASFGLNTRAKVTEASPLSLYVASSETGDYLSLFSVSVGKVTYKFNPDPTKLCYEEKALNIASGEYFDLSIYVEKGNTVDTVYFSIKTDGGAEWTDSYTYGNDTTDFLAGKFKFDYAYLAATSATFNYVEMYPGTFQRYVDNSKNVEIIADAVVNAYADYLNFKNDSKVESDAFELAEMIAKISVLYEYPLNSVADATVKGKVQEAFEDCVKTVSAVYADDIADKNAEMQKDTNEAKDYNERLTLVTELLGYKSYMTNLKSSVYASDSGVDFTAIGGIFDNADKEAARLAEIEANSIFVVEETSKIANIYLATYHEIKVAYEAIKDVEIYESYSSELYPAAVVLEAFQKKNAVVATYPTLTEQAQTFVTNVIIAANPENNFIARYYAYINARENVFEDTTYDKYLDGTTIAELNSKFALVEAEIGAVSEIAEQFLAKIREAALTPSYTVKIKALDEAKPYLDVVEKGYPEVEEAITSYYAMRDDITARQEAARRYVQAVLNVQIASTVKEKVIAIEIAEAFAVLGSEYTIEIEEMRMTVTEANVILANEKFAISDKATRISNYVAAANAVSEKETLLERRQAINAALAIKASLTEDKEEEDVISANAVLDDAIKAYNNDVSRANATATETDNAVLSILSKSVPSKRIAEVVAIVKKFYE